MTLEDALLILLLVDRIHATNESIRAAAKRCAKKLPRRHRDVMFKVGTSADPRQLLVQLCQHLDD